MIKTIISICLLIFTFNCSIASAANSNESNEQAPRFAIHLLDYLAHDYSGAVVDGKIFSQSEYEEQCEFIEKVVELTQKLPELKEHYAIQTKAKNLKALIANKASAQDVSLLARDIQKDLIAITKVELAPESSPSLTNGKMLFEQNCMACHGQNGYGDGIKSRELNPKPANFHKAERMEQISAFHSYNTIRLGVPGTAMVAFSQFSDQEVWDLAFYVMSLRHRELALQNKDKFNIEGITLEEAATLSDIQLKEKLTIQLKLNDENQKSQALALLRVKNDKTTPGDYISKAKNYLNQSLISYKENSKDQAKRLSVQAYLEGIEPIESTIKANNPELVVKIETAMGAIRKTIIDDGDQTLLLTKQIDQTTSLFNEVAESIGTHELSFGVAFSGAFAIILREGFEAVLIILTLLSVIKAFGNKQAAMWVHAGWSSALFLGFIAWFLSGMLMKMSGASREVLEACTSTVAVFILLYFGFWLHRQTEISRWKKFIQEKVQGAINNKNLWALASISFISVFREAFETVLFIRALWFQTNDSGKNAISFGLIAALALIFGFSYLTLRYSKKLPVRQLFKVSSILTCLLAFILAGKAAHSLQEAGWLNVTSLPWNFRIDTIGFFPTIQTMISQAITLTVALILINFNNKTSAPKAPSSN